MVLILEVFGVAVCFGGKSHSVVWPPPKDPQPNPDPHPVMSL